VQATPATDTVTITVTPSTVTTPCPEGTEQVNGECQPKTK
jgi:hypothetical protein